MTTLIEPKCKSSQEAIFCLEDALAFRTVVINDKGIHARPGGVLVKTASKYESDVRIYNESNSREANVKSIMGLLTIEAAEGNTVRFEARGRDALECITDLYSVTLGEVFRKY
jgi:phosphocarrier protein